MKSHSILSNTIDGQINYDICVNQASIYEISVCEQHFCFRRFRARGSGCVRCLLSVAASGAPWACGPYVLREWEAPLPRSHDRGLFHLWKLRGLDHMDQPAVVIFLKNFFKTCQVFAKTWRYNACIGWRRSSYHISSRTYCSVLFRIIGDRAATLSPILIRLIYHLFFQIYHNWISGWNDYWYVGPVFVLAV